MKRYVIGVVLLVVMAGFVYAQWDSKVPVNRDRTFVAETTELSVTGTCQPESDGTAVGWDQTPTSGSWGGKNESDFAVVWEPGTPDVPANAGRFAECTIAGVTTRTPKKVRMLVLEGLANDDYCVFASVAAGDLLIGCVNETNVGAEAWVNKEFTLPAGAFASGQDVTVKILVTANAWPSFSTWGQLGVDQIEILAE